MAELSWEYLFSVLERAPTYIQEHLEQAQKLGFDITTAPGALAQLETLIGLRAVLPRLYSDPTIKNLIPYKGHNALRWWPAKDYLLVLDTSGNRDNYRVTLVYNKEIVAQTIVGIDDVIETLLTYMRKAVGES